MKRTFFLVMLLGLMLTNGTAKTTDTPFTGYLFAYFEGGGDQNLMEQLRFAVSEDAQNWYARNSIFSTVHPQKRSSQPSGKFSLQHRFEAF